MPGKMLAKGYLAWDSASGVREHKERFRVCRGCVQTVFCAAEWKVRVEGQGVPDSSGSIIAPQACFARVWPGIGCNCE